MDNFSKYKQTNRTKFVMIWRTSQGVKKPEGKTAKGRKSHNSLRKQLGGLTPPTNPPPLAIQTLYGSHVLQDAKSPFA